MADKIYVQGNEIRIISREQEDYISLTDMANHRNKEDPFAIIDNWMRSRSTIEFLGLWEKLSNPDFKPIEFERFAIHQMKLLTDAQGLKGQEDLDVPLKMERLRQWCEDINRVQKDVEYDFVYMDEDSFERFKPTTFRQLLEGFKEYRGAAHPNANAGGKT